jgi:hypothetical protein
MSDDDWDCEACDQPDNMAAHMLEKAEAKIKRLTKERDELKAALAVRTKERDVALAEVSFIDTHQRGPSQRLQRSLYSYSPLACNCKRLG